MEYVGGCIIDVSGMYQEMYRGCIKGYIEGCIKPTKLHWARYITLCDGSSLGMYQVYGLLWSRRKPAQARQVSLFRPSRGISPLQTQAQGSGGAGNIVLMPSAAGGLPSAQPSPVKQSRTTPVRNRSWHADARPLRTRRVCKRWETVT